MTYAATHLPEFDHEMATTRKVLERLPDEHWDWKAHEKSNSIGWNANHLAEIPGWLENMLSEPGFDFNPPGGPRYESPTLRTRAEVLDLFDRNVAMARAALERAKDSAMNEPWSLLDGGMAIITMPRAATVRTWFFSHTIHHRAILTVYYRLLGVPVPAIYGPSGDEG
jgi:uncharacterized damage-inducible protein DinB